MTNCKNCGAVLKGNICEYCGTNYEINYIPKSDTKATQKRHIETENPKAKTNVFEKCGVTLSELANAFNAF